MEAFLFVCEVGVIANDLDTGENLVAVPFSGDKAKKYLALMSGETLPEFEYALSTLKQKGVDSVLYNEPVVLGAVSRFFPRCRLAPKEKVSQFEQSKMERIIGLGLAKDEAEVLEVIREVSLSSAATKLQELIAVPDLHIIQAIQSLDELDKSSNVLLSRVKEWFGLHFPELVRLVEDNSTFAKIVGEGLTRENLKEEDLLNFSFSKGRISAILETKNRSKGSPLGERERHILRRIAESAIKLMNDRDKIQEYVDSTMRSVAPNLTAISGATIGARLISKAGGLEKLARMPASKIQILGAEKALYRALRSGSRPPKHGIIFQHQLVHSAPKWQRGKIARSLASKIAIAARIDAYRGEQQSGFEAVLQKKVDEIKAKYPKPRIKQRDEIAYVRKPGLRRNRKH
jgi:nucleolar protein 56